MAKITDLSKVKQLTQELWEADDFLRNANKMRFYVCQLDGNEKYVGTPGYKGFGDQRAQDAYRKTAEKLVKTHRNAVLDELKKLGIEP